MKANNIYLLHILIAAPIFIYIGHNPIIKEKWLQYLLIGLGALVILYHGFLFRGFEINKNLSWVHIFHIVIVGPFLLNAGLNKRLLYPLDQISLIMGYGALVNFLIKQSKLLY